MKNSNNSATTSVKIASANFSRTKLPLILAIDTSCDETSAAVTLGRVVLANIIASQAEIHAEYGGVFPTLAKRAHQQNLEPTINKALKQASVKPQQLDAVAVTLGPGLAPALETGIKQAQKLAKKWNKPLIAVNHIEAHLLSVLATRNKRHFPVKQILKLKMQRKTLNPDLVTALPTTSIRALNQSLNNPILGMVFSGGHSQFVLIDKIGQYQILGETVDDAVGEALDKVGRMLGLGYPAAPVIEKLAKKGHPDRFDFPLPMTTVKNFNLSYSGLKTAAHRLIIDLENEEKLDQKAIIDLAAAFQKAVFRHITYKLDKLLEELIRNKNKKINQAWQGGGVTQNVMLRRVIRKTLSGYDITLKTPYENRLCSDNAAMIGVTAGLKYGVRLNQIESLDRKPNWSIEAPTTIKPV